MVTGLAFLATALASLFAESTLVRATQRRSDHLWAWTVALAMFALASAALAIGVSTGWDRGTFRAFYLLGAVLNVPWLALGTVALLAGPDAARRVRWFLVGFSGLAVGVLVSVPMGAVGGTEIPVGKDVFGALPRILAGIGSGVGATVIVVGALWSGVRYARDRGTADRARMAVANLLIAVGTLVLSSGGLVQGIVGHDEAFSLSLAVGIGVIYTGFVVAEGRSSRGSSFPVDDRGSSSTTS
ncbi:MAG TPA: hypothetical protein VFW06_00870 [Acidimicrobiia bacterium]|nr:hypothetical protein [Acidimicrobiia bacterium]